MKALVSALTLVTLSLLTSVAHAYENPFHQKVSLRVGALNVNFKDVNVAYYAADAGLEYGVQLLETPMYGILGGGAGFAGTRSLWSHARLTVGIGAVIHRFEKKNAAIALQGKAHGLLFEDNKPPNGVPMHLVGSLGLAAIVGPHFIAEGGLLVGTGDIGFEAHLGYAF